MPQLDRLFSDKRVEVDGHPPWDEAETRVARRAKQKVWATKLSWRVLVVGALLVWWLGRIWADEPPYLIDMIGGPPAATILMLFLVAVVAAPLFAGGMRSARELAEEAATRAVKAFREGRA